MSFSTLIAIMTTSANATQVSQIMNRIYEVVASVSAILIAILWIPIALNFFSDDEEKRYSAKLRLKNAFIGTVIYVMAISGTLYTIFLYLATGS